MTDPVPSKNLSIDPCPFCREAINSESEESWYFRGDGPPPSYAVRCDSCGAQGPYGNGKFRKDHAGAQSEAVRRWNERARAAPEPGAALVNVLPKITDEVVNLLWGTDLIESDGPGEKWGWSQGAVDFACLLNEGLHARRAAQPPTERANAVPDDIQFAMGLLGAAQPPRDGQ